MSFLGCFQLFFSKSDNNLGGMTKEVYLKRKFFQKISSKHGYFKLIDNDGDTLIQCTLCVENFVCAKPNVIKHLASENHAKNKKLKTQHAVISKMSDSEFKSFVEKYLSDSGFSSHRIAELLPFFILQTGRSENLAESTDKNFLNELKINSSSLRDSFAELFFEPEVYESSFNVSAPLSTEITEKFGSNVELDS